MEKLKAFFTEHKTKIIAAAVILGAFIIYKKMKK